jgi:hypothetical protein
MKDEVEKLMEYFDDRGLSGAEALKVMTILCEVIKVTKSKEQRKRVIRIVTKDQT